MRHQSPHWAPWLLGLGFREGSPTCLTAQVSPSKGFTLQLPTVKALLSLDTSCPGGKSSGTGEAIEVVCRLRQKALNPPEWEAPGVGRGDKSVLWASLRCSSWLRLPVPGSSTDAVFPLLYPLCFHPGTVPDPKECKLGRGDGGDFQLPFKLGCRIHRVWCYFPLLKNKLPSETWLEVMPHNWDLQGRFWVSLSLFPSPHLHQQRQDLPHSSL